MNGAAIRGTRILTAGVVLLLGGACQCRSQGAVDSGLVDAASDAGAVDAGTFDAGALDAGTADAGLTSRDPAPGSWDERNLIPGFGGDSAYVAAVVRAGTALYVGGHFTAVHGRAALNVARFDGNRWVPMGAGLSGTVKALALDARGRVTAAGAVLRSSSGGFGVAQFDGSAWTFLPGTFDGEVRALLWHGDVLYVTGTFTHIDSLASAGVARLESGSWSSLAQGEAIIGNTLLLSAGGDLCVGGDFTSIDGVAATAVACRHSTTWAPLGVFHDHNPLDPTSYHLRGGVVRHRPRLEQRRSSAWACPPDQWRVAKLGRWSA